MPTLLRLFGMRPPPPACVLDVAAEAAIIRLRGDVTVQLKVAPSATSAWRERNQVAMIVVDMQHARPFGDSLRPLITDQRLRLVETALKACIRSSDSVTRTDEQQFSILLNRVTGPEGISRAFARIVKALESRGHPATGSSGAGRGIPN